MNKYALGSLKQFNSLLAVLDAVVDPAATLALFCALRVIALPAFLAADALWFSH